MSAPNSRIPLLDDERRVAAAWERFVQNEPLPVVPVRNIVLDSWLRCQSEAVNPASRSAPVTANSKQVAQMIERYRDLCEVARPVLETLRDILRESGGGIVLLTDPTGLILDLAGESRTRDAAERINLMPGGCWREEIIGTNAIGTAIATLQPVQIHASEHYCLDIKSWTCAAAPILDPFDQTLLGVLDVSGRKRSFQGQTLGMVISAAKQIESALARSKLEQSMGSQAQREKLASLGRLMAGVAHNLNTPLGVSLTAASKLKDSIDDLSQQIELGLLRKQALLDFISQCQEAAYLLEKNTQRVASLVGDFKQVAVDRSCLSHRQFELREELSALLPTLQEQLESHHHHLIVEVEPGLLFDSFPDLIMQIFTTLITLSLSKNAGTTESIAISIEAKRAQDDQVAISYRDYGEGLPEIMTRHIFDPFFTTSLGDVANGLGLFTAYNHVTSILGGTIEIPGHAGEGMLIEILLPRAAPLP